MNNLTEPCVVGHAVDSYIAITDINAANRVTIADIQAAIQHKFPERRFWLPSGDQLHNTFAHIITCTKPHAVGTHLSEWQRLEAQADVALTAAASGQNPFEIIYDTVQASPGAIVLRAIGSEGQDYDAMRQRFSGDIELPEYSRRPPNIIHSTIARYHDALPFAPIEEFVKALRISLRQPVTQIRLIHETVLPAEAYELIRDYRLG